MITTKNNKELVACDILSIEFYINSRLVQETVSAEMTALKLIREKLHLTGAKEPCSEGDCGGCTVALGTWGKGGFRYQAINSCILPASRLHGTHVITIEGLAEDKKLHLIQKEMLERHAVQCGFCSSGVIMSIFCLLLDDSAPDSCKIINALSGNLCRCTGYKFINDAILSTINKLKNSKSLKLSLTPSYATSVQKELKKLNGIKQVSLPSDGVEVCKNYYVPSDFKELFLLMRKLKTKFAIINGGTDLMVQGNIHDIWPESFIDVSRIRQLNFIEEQKGKVIIGGNVTFEQLQSSSLVQRKLPTLLIAISQMASSQVRNVATLAGNLVNASPIADSVCVLLALGATLLIKKIDGESRVRRLEEFFLDYKITELDKDKEIISAIEVPYEANFCSFEKTAKRSTLDIATVNSCINLEIKKSVIKSCRLAFGGVAKFPILAKATSSFLISKKITSENINQAKFMSANEFTPINDVRGSAEYRHLLIQNHIVKHFAKIIMV